MNQNNVIATMNNSPNFAQLLFKDHTIRYQIEDDDLWLCAKDLAKPLNKSESTIRDNLKDIPTDWRMSVQSTTNSGIQKFTFINKRAALKIIMKTRTSSGSKIDNFQNWAVTKLDELLSTGKAEIQNQKMIQLTNQLQQQQKQLKQQQQQLETKENQLKKSQDKNMKLTTFCDNIKAATKTQIFYLTTTDSYSARSRYKFGGVQDESLLVSNLRSYNRGEAAGNYHYYVYIAKCYDYKLIEKSIKSVLPLQFKDNQSKRNEMVYCYYPDLKSIVDKAIESTIDLQEYVNTIKTSMINNITDAEPVKPPPIPVGNQTTVTVQDANGIRHTRVFDMNSISDKNIFDGIKQALNTYANDQNISTNYNYDQDKDIVKLPVIWTDFQKYIQQQFGMKPTQFKATEWKQKLKALIKKENNKLYIRWKKT